MKNLTVSIILPTHNGTGYIKNSVDSILKQTLNDFEVIIIDDGSTDSTEDIIKEICKNDSRVFYYKNSKNIGLPSTLNNGLSLSKGKYIARIDDDDLWLSEDKLKKQIDFLEKNPEYGLIGTNFITLKETSDKKDEVFLPTEDGDIRNKILSFNTFCHSSVVFRKDLISDKTKYNNKLTYTEDWDLWLQIGLISKFKNLDESMVQYTIRNGISKNKTKYKQIKYHARILLKYGFYYPNRLIAVLKIINYTIFY